MYLSPAKLSPCRKDVNWERKTTLNYQGIISLITAKTGKRGLMSVEEGKEIREAKVISGIYAFCLEIITYERH